MTSLTVQHLENEECFKALFQHATIGILIVGQDRHIQLANPFVEKLVGYSCTELVGKPVEILIPDDLRQIHHQHQESYFKNPGARPMGKGKNLHARHKNGSIFPVEISLGYYRQDNDYLAVAFISDITERRLAETRYEEETEWIRFLNEAMKRLWSIHNLNDGLLEILSTSMKLLQTDLGNVQLLDPEKQVLIIAAQKGFRKEFLEHFREVSATSNSVCGEAFRKRKQMVLNDVEKEPFFAPHLEVARNAGFRAVQSTPLYDQDGLPIAMISTHSPNPGHFNPQSLKRMELYARYVEGFMERIRDHDTIEQINLGLEEKVKERTGKLTDALAREKEVHEMKSAFVAMASHEFRTPLSAILTSASLVEKYDQTDQQDKREKHIGRIKSSVSHLVELLNVFLSLNKLEEGKVQIDTERFHLEDFLRGIITELDGMKKEHQCLQFTCKGITEVQLDKKIVRNIVLNLLSNAIKYSDKDIEINAEVDYNQVMLMIKDQGIGIPAEQQKNMFGKFFRASNAGSIQGTGLGLNIVKHYVDLMNGTIDFTSRENEGTTFTIRLPNCAPVPHSDSPIA